MITILQISAIGDSNEILMHSTTPDGLKRNIEIEGLNPLLRVLNPARYRLEVLLDGGANAGVRPLSVPQLVYNAISEPDRCSQALRRAELAGKQNAAIPVINRPEAIRGTTPEQLCRRLENITELRVPKAIRIAPHSLRDTQKMIESGGLKPPLIFKESGTAPGEPNLFLLEEGISWHTLERFAFDGRPYDVIEFIDTRDSDGYYRKHRVYCIGDRLLPGHLILSKQWHVTDDTTAHEGLEGDRASTEEEETRFLARFDPQNYPVLNTIRQHMDLDYCCIDFALNDDQIILFNVTAKHHYFSAEKREGYYSDVQIRAFNEAVEAMVERKINSGGV